MHHMHTLKGPEWLHKHTHHSLAHKHNKHSFDLDLQIDPRRQQHPIAKSDDSLSTTAPSITYCYIKGKHEINCPTLQILPT